MNRTASRAMAVASSQERGPVRRPGVLVVLAAGAVVACAGLLTGTGSAPAAASVRGAAAQVHWGRAAEVPGLGALNAGGNAQVSSVSCWRPGDCAAGGSYTDARQHLQLFVVMEASGRWKNAQQVPGTAVLNFGGGLQVNSMSCAPGGYCAAVGAYDDNKGNQQVFVVTETGGRWGAAHEIPGTGKLNVGGYANASSVSCPSAGNCAAGGYYQTYNPPGSGYNSNQAFVVSERNGRWAKAEAVPGIEQLSPPPYENDDVLSVSCASAGNCTAGGYWWGLPCAPGTPICPRGFVLTEVNGRWHRLAQPKGGGPVSSVSCWHAGDCLAGGTLDLNGGTNPPDYIPFAETQTNGRWGTARPFRAQVGFSMNSVSCPSAGNCATAGNTGPTDNDWLDAPFVFTERSGRWGKVQDLAGPADSQSTSAFSALSCPSAGNCGAGGSYISGFDQYGNPLTNGFVVGERDSRWAISQVPPGLAALNVGGNAGVNSVSCPSAGTCVAGGFYTDPAGHSQAFVDGSK